MRRDVFQAIADPTRRNIIGLVVQKPMNLNSLADEFSISRPAVSKHVKILTECGLLIIKKEGRERYCEAKLEQLNQVASWVEQYRKFWNDKLDALDLYLTNLQEQEKTGTNNKKQQHKKSKHGKRKNK